MKNKEVKEKKESLQVGNTTGCNDLHVILTYKNEVKTESIEKDVLIYLVKIRKNITYNFEYCYRVNPITEGHPAVHILIKTGDSMGQEELKSLWGKGIAKVALLESFDKRAVSYYFKSWNSDIHRSRGFSHEYIY